MAIEVLRLEVREFLDLTRWRWVLTDSSGRFLAEHEVRLDASAAEYEAFGDLRGYLRWHCAPDQPAVDEARIVGEVGAWIGSALLGPVAAAIARLRPVTVRVVVPPEAAELLYRPLELAHSDGKPLAVQDVTLVMQVGIGTAHVAPVGERLRVLGLFSLPEGGRPLNLRRERAELVRLLRGIAVTGKAVDVRVLQYGVTRNRLREILSEAEGWDIIHVSGHGSPGSLTLETASGEPDRVTAAELVGLLDPARPRLKLVTVSACWSAAVLADEQRRLFGLPVTDQDQGDSARRDRGASPPSPSSGALASELCGQLGCAVLAMRYPVADDFAIALSGTLYGLLVDKGQPLPRAVGMTLRKLSTATDGTGPAGGLASGKAYSGAFPALSFATPALFGGTAADLHLAAPSGRSSESRDIAVTMAGFPPEPQRFVGRTGVLTRSSSALAPGSAVPGVLLHGMPGGGKTACALELAYGHEEAFDRLIWYKAPDQGMDVSGALTDFALTLERYLDGFQIAHVLVSAKMLAAFLPRLTELLERRRLLIVIDNLESLMDDNGAWRDERWGLVVDALCRHAGLGRVILTSRHLPASGVGRLQAEAVDALAADEALLLTRELPNLTALKLGRVPGLEMSMSRMLARNAIAMAQGHPNLLELAEGQAANHAHLLELIRAGDQEWRRLHGVPEGFFTDKEAPSGEDYLHILAAWTRAVSDTLTPGERDLFWFLCCLEEPDREWRFLKSTWTHLWNRLSRDSRPPSIDQAMSVLAARGLVELAQPNTTADVSSDDTVPRGDTRLYAVHPGVAAAARAHAGLAFRSTVDFIATAFWSELYLHASGEIGDSSMNTKLAARAAFAAIPYLIRQQAWTPAAALLERAFVIDPSRSSAAKALPAIVQISRHDRRQAGLLGRVQQVFDPAAAEVTLRAALDAAVNDNDYAAASVAASVLAQMCLNSGRLTEALAFTEQQLDNTRRAGRGPWTQIADYCQQLQVLNAMGRADQVLAEVQRLRPKADALPTALGSNETTSSWKARELLLDAGRGAAQQLGRWDYALELNAANIASKRDRRATATEIADARFNDYYPLLRLGRTEQAMAILLDCRQVYLDTGDTVMLGKVFGALASVEAQRTHGDAALRLECDALRYRYLAEDVRGIAVSYHNVGTHLRRDRQYSRAFASHLASALIRTIIRNLTEEVSSSVIAAAIDLHECNNTLAAPRDVADLGEKVGDIPGTDLPGLLARLSSDPEVVELALRDLIVRAQGPPTAPFPDQDQTRG